MAPSATIVGICVSIALLGAPAKAEDIAGAACDRLAGNPDDPHRIGPGVPFFLMDGPAAIVACVSAVREDPTSVRFEYQLALALARSKRYADAIEPLREAARAGYAAAEADLGYAYADLGIPRRDFAEGFRWAMLAANQDYTPAMNDVGFDYAYGRGVPRDVDQALAWYRRAVARGDRYAQKHMGDMYRDGLGVKPSDEEAVRWYQLSVQQGYRGAQTALALMCLEGRGGPRDVPRALELLTLAAAQEEPEAIAKLAELGRPGARGAEPK